MKIAFTICSNNYLSQAKVLCNSLTEHNPDYRFIIGLCDKKTDIVDYQCFAPAEIIEVERIGIANFDWMTQHYDIVELNTAIKPYYFEYFMLHYPQFETIMYFDPDIVVYDSLRAVEDELRGKSAVLTPHITTNIALDGLYPSLNVFLAHGLYNLGFLAISNSNEAKRIIRWWAEYLANHCIKRLSNGYFVDQLPMNFAPLFFDDVCVSKNLGFNYAYWNFHERELTVKNDKYYINDSFPLIFTHFSAFTPRLPLEICRFKTLRYTMEEGTVLYNFFMNYSNKLVEADFWKLKPIPCYYVGLHTKFILEKQRAERRDLKKRFKTIAHRIKHLFDLESKG
ncbi:MAG: hypothetical protein LBV75_08600 [Paludibacter sp.]|jgi:lipopolysaccharide biosynthesis glycosyltransferase|nr:hypothetical protein [Paludibacter sp.]